MFESISYLFLQHYWWAIISLLGALLVFLFFVQGGQTLIYSFGKNESERTILVNCLGRKWEITFTTLVTFGGAFFASFPLFYSTSFGGAYWVWILILFCFILQAVSYEFRSKPANIFGHRTFEIFLFINGAVGTILVGTAVGTFFTGSSFSVDFKSITQVTDPVISRWQGPYRGLEAAFNIQNMALGLSVFFLSRILAGLYFINSINHDEIVLRAHKSVLRNTIPFIVVFLTFLVLLLTKKGFAVDPSTSVVSMEKFKYLHNLVQVPLVALLFLGGVALVLYGIGKTMLTENYQKGIWFSGVGTILTVFGLFLLAGYNHTAYYPSVYDLQSSLTIENSSSSRYTLTAMSYVSLFVPFVVLYLWYAWRALNREKITAEEMKTETHVY
ncbi:MAG TPA: cytochrome d ubiquinol oxidase subunit II [Bacteroidales bacterium]|nr:cytochrome d ubiquinol oxidase subunit II [Bacteroidales bacterium]